MKRYWAELATTEFAALPAERAIAILPVAATEQHGPHLPLSVDTAILDGVIRATLPLLPPALPALYLPTLAIGKSNEHALYPGTLTVGAETLMRVWREIAASVAAAGLRKFVLFNSHGGQSALMDVAIRDIREAHGMLAFAVNWYMLGLPAGLYGDGELKHGIHGGDLETSMMLALKPDTVRMDKAANFVSATETLARDYPDIALAGPAKIGWMTQDMNQAGACGDASRATAEKGAATIAHVARRFVNVLGQIDRLPADWLKRRA